MRTVPQACATHGHTVRQRAREVRASSACIEQLLKRTNKHPNLLRAILIPSEESALREFTAFPPAPSQ